MVSFTVSSHLYKAIDTGFIIGYLYVLVMTFSRLVCHEKRW